MDIGIATSVDTKEEATDYDDRESVQRLKVVGRGFLKFSSAVVDVQYISVRDFIHSEEKLLPQDPRICPECVKRMNQDLFFQASPKHGHLVKVGKKFGSLCPIYFKIISSS